MVDNNNIITNTVSTYLRNEGYDKIQVSDSHNALKIIKEECVDLVILDIMIDELNRIELCNEIREKCNKPIIFLSTKEGKVVDKIIGLSSEYTTKQFTREEFILRVRLEIKKHSKVTKGCNCESIIKIGDLKIDSNTKQVFIGNRKIIFTQKEFCILDLLAKNKGRVMSIPEIYKGVWKENFFKSDNTVMVHISNIRRKIETDPKNCMYIKTVRRVGYRI
nr:response regulator transcription factor [Clostridium sp. Marseille-Q2269]